MLESKPKKSKRPKEPLPPQTIPIGTRALHLALPDGRHYLTSQQHLGVLIEFARTFKAEISVVEMEEETLIYDLDALVAMICAATTTMSLPQHKLIEMKVKNPVNGIEVRSRREQLAEVSGYVNNALIERGICSIHELLDKFREIEKPVLSNVLNRVVQRMRRQHYALVRVSVGVFRVVPAENIAS